MIKVLIVDDSAMVRKTMQNVLASDPALTVIGAASDPYQAVQLMQAQKPDVIVLDVEMPRMDGLTFLQRIMNQHPIPVVICSSLAMEGCETTLRALDYGAVDIITKPKLGTDVFLQEAKILICDCVKAASKVSLSRLRMHHKTQPKLTADAVLAKGIRQNLAATTQKIIVVGASTGGTEALTIFMKMMPENAPGVVIVQHMPEHFTHSFAKRLNTMCRMSISEAENNQTITDGHAMIAPGNRHLLVRRSGTRYYVEVRDGPLVSRHRPSVDVLFRSAARFAGANAVGVIMTGMGDDGANGMKELYDTGAYTIAQDEATCVVYGMPKEAVARGGVKTVLPLQKIANNVIR